MQGNNGKVPDLCGGGRHAECEWRAGSALHRGSPAALTSEWGVHPNDRWLSAEGVVPAGLAAIVILVTVWHGHLVRSAGQAERG